MSNEQGRSTPAFRNCKNAIEVPRHPYVLFFALVLNVEQILAWKEHVLVQTL